MKSANANTSATLTMTTQTALRHLVLLPPRSLVFATLISPCAKCIFWLNQPSTVPTARNTMTAPIAAGVISPSLCCSDPRTDDCSLPKPTPAETPCAGGWQDGHDADNPQHDLEGACSAMRQDLTATTIDITGAGGDPIEAYLAVPGDGARSS